MVRGLTALACLQLALGSTVYVDTSAVGHAYEGLGGCSAGTGPRLLVDYPSDVRAAILDFLFLPNFGASLDILKVLRSQQ